MRYLVFIAFLFFVSIGHAEKFVYIHKHMLVTDEGNVYSMDTGYADDGPWGDLGKEFYLGRKPGPFLGQVEFLKDIKKIIVAKAAFIALANDGKVYSWGLNKAPWTGGSSIICGGFLGMDKEFVAEPKRLHLDDNEIADIVLSPCSDIAALTKKGEVYVWGSDSALNDKNPGYSSIPKKVPVPKNIISASPEVFITKDGSIYYFGSAYYANRLKTLLPKCEKHLCVAEGKNALKVSAYSEITLVDGTVHYPHRYQIEAGKVEGECITAFYNESYLSCDGVIYRIGLLAKYKGWISSTQDEYVEEFECTGEYQNVSWFTRDAFVKTDGSVWVYGYDEMGEGYEPYYRSALTKQLKSYDFNDLDFLIDYHKVVDSAILNSSPSEQLK